MRRGWSRLALAAGAVLIALAGCAEQRRAGDAPHGDAALAPLKGGSTVEGDLGGAKGTASAADSQGQPTNESRPAPWPFRPASLRVHPLSHALRTDGVVSVVEARVEFFDRFGHTTKALGLIRIELHAADSTPGVGRRLAAWEIDLTDIDANVRHYDDVTRTYLFRLGLDGIGDPPSSARLSATAILRNQKLSGSLIIALR